MHGESRRLLRGWCVEGHNSTCVDIQVKQIKKSSNSTLLKTLAHGRLGGLAVSAQR